MSVLRHIHERKNLAPYPHPRWVMRWIDGAAVTAGIIGPLMTLPQVLKIYVEHNASGVSALSWFAFAIADIPLFIYGVAHRDKVLIITYAAWFVLNLVVAFGAIIYG